MPYVMVPVPEQHLLDVMRYIMRLASQAPPETPRPWDQVALERLLADSNTQTRALLTYLADPVRAGREVRARDVADDLELAAGDVPGIVGPLNRHFRRENREPLIESRAITVSTRSGKQAKRRTLVMSETVAPLVLAAEAAV